jgi:RNA recognition motif-containing protein
VTDEVLIKAFHHYPSFQRARVIRDKRTGKSRGFGFVSFSDLNDFARAMREMNGTVATLN